MNNTQLAFDAGTILTPFERFSPGRLLVRGDRVEAVGLPGDVHLPAGFHALNFKHLTLVPGFIEPHVHGCGGHDMMDATPESMRAICTSLASHGTTSFLATTVSAPIETLTPAIENLSRLLHGNFGGAQPLGLHLEGPFINEVRRGTHQTSNIHPPDPDLLSRWMALSEGTIKLLTMAPELQGAAAVASVARTLGITVGMGHSDASFEQATSATAEGTRYAVHTFNAMRPFSHRDPGIVGAILADERIYAEIIADGIHVAPGAVRVLAKAKGPGRVILATDGTSATGMPDGTYALGGERVQVCNGVCRDAEGRLAGSTLTQDRALANFMEWTGMRLEDALLSLTANPAAALGLVGRGSLEPGAFADIVALDDRLHVAHTFVGGSLAFDRRR